MTTTKYYNEEWEAPPSEAFLSLLKDASLDTAFPNAEQNAAAFQSLLDYADECQRQQAYSNSIAANAEVLRAVLRGFDRVADVVQRAGNIPDSLFADSVLCDALLCNFVLIGTHARTLIKRAPRFCEETGTLVCWQWFASICQHTAAFQAELPGNKTLQNESFIMAHEYIPRLTDIILDEMKTCCAGG
ncbi:MAG: hypothetical protein LBQ91_01940 [Oscillospiraceae bacterium]|jgi:hypothetical protein|nr:hypothetical protein [Oscillospiraceae bacterium]